MDEDYISWSPVYLSDFDDESSNDEDTTRDNTSTTYTDKTHTTHSSASHTTHKDENGSTNSSFPVHGTDQIHLIQSTAAHAGTKVVVSCATYYYR